MANNNRRNLLKWAKRAVTGLFLLAVVGMVVYAWMPKPLPVETAEVTRGPLVVTVDEDGRARVKDRYIVSAPLAGKLARIELHPGDEVEEGGVLARIVPLEAPLLDAPTRASAEARVAAARAGVKQARAQIERAKVAVESAKAERARIEPLVGQGIEASASLERAALDERSREAELASAQFAAQVANYELQMAESALGRLSGDVADSVEQLEVPGPVAGRVLQVIQESEGVVQAGTPLLELGNPAALEIVVDVLTRDAVQIERGAPAMIERWGGEPLTATVRLIEPSAFTRLSSLGVEEQRVNAILDLDEPYEVWAGLGDGYRVEARITIWREDDVVKVPGSALFRHGEGWAVFVIADEHAKLVAVEPGRRNGLEAQILSGLEPGDRVILHPSDRVEDGVAVSWR